MHAHLFRHGYAINFLNYGGRLDALQEQLGHRDINTTRIYLRLSDEDIKREVAKIQFYLSLPAFWKVYLMGNTMARLDWGIRENWFLILPQA